MCVPTKLYLTRSHPMGVPSLWWVLLSLSFQCGLQRPADIHHVYLGDSQHFFSFYFSVNHMTLVKMYQEWSFEIILLLKKPLAKVSKAPYSMWHRWRCIEVSEQGFLDFAHESAPCCFVLCWCSWNSLDYTVWCREFIWVASPGIFLAMFGWVPGEAGPLLEELRAHLPANDVVLCSFVLCGFQEKNICAAGSV